MYRSDGQIVGTGRSDFTVDTQAYRFQAGGQNFELLDVPGIEGKETKVMDSIMGAVKSAHAVFYVTGKGFDIAKLLKFKPYGAINLAKGVNGALSVIGLGLELWDSYEKYRQEEKIKETKKTMVSNFNQQRTELLSLINGPKFITQFCPELIELQTNVQDVEKVVHETRSKREQFLRWRATGEAIDAEFKMLDPA